MDNQTPSPNLQVPHEKPGMVMPDTLASPGVAAEQMPQAEPGSAPAAGPAQVAPQLSAADAAAAIAAIPTAAGAPVTAAGTPSVAGDVDVIEPEWVDKAEQVIQAHQGDPYAEEEAIEELQEDYLQKRYGINVADPDAGDNPKGP